MLALFQPFLELMQFFDIISPRQNELMFSGLLFLSHPCRLDRDSVQPDKDALLRKLMEAEVDGTAAAKEVSALRESVSKICSASGSVSICRPK